MKRCKTIPDKTMPSKKVLSKTMPSKKIPSKTIPSEELLGLKIRTLFHQVFLLSRFASRLQSFTQSFRDSVSRCKYQVHTYGDTVLGFGHQQDWMQSHIYFGYQTISEIGLYFMVILDVKILVSFRLLPYPGHSPSSGQGSLFTSPSSDILLLATFVT